MLTSLPYINCVDNSSYYVPSEEDCYKLWDYYDMLAHIRAHSQGVAEFAYALAQRSYELGKIDIRDLSLAAGLLHDIAKSYTVQYGGNHTQVGASWVLEKTGNPILAQAVLHHVYYPFELDFDVVSRPALFVIYADKRVMHNKVVSLNEREEDLLVRYGYSEASINGVKAGMAHGRKMEKKLSECLEIDLEKCTLDSRRLVERA